MKRFLFVLITMYIAVVGNNGAFSPKPYSLQIEASKPMDISTLANDACSPVVTTTGTKIQSELIADYGNKALIVTQRERMIEKYGNWLSMKEQLVKLGANIIRDTSGNLRVDQVKMQFSGKTSKLSTVVGNVESALIKSINLAL